LKGKKTKAPIDCVGDFGNANSNTGSIGTFPVSEVTLAFDLAEGSLTTVDDYDTFQCFKKSYALSDKIDVPYYLKDLQVTTPTLRSQFSMIGLRLAIPPGRFMRITLWRSLLAVALKNQWIRRAKQQLMS
jgi:hypothetical protein